MDVCYYCSYPAGQLVVLPEYHDRGCGLLVAYCMMFCIRHHAKVEWDREIKLKDEHGGGTISWLHRSPGLQHFPI